jgi:hypothetical protein
MRDLDQLTDSLVRARREHAVAVGRGDHSVADTLRVAIRRLEQMIASVAADYHVSEGC